MALIREDIEWSQFRWNSTLDEKLPRVLLVGDSIIVATWEKVVQRLAGQVNIAYFSTSKCVGDPDYDREIAHALSDYKWALVYFNNGLHGFTATESEYAAGLKKVMGSLIHAVGKTGLLWRTSTPITVVGHPEQLDSELNARVIERNRRAAAIAAEYGIPTDDLYAVVVGKPELSAGDGYHYNQQGTDLQADHIAATIRAALKIKG